MDTTWIWNMATQAMEWFLTMVKELGDTAKAMNEAIDRLKESKARIDNLESQQNELDSDDESFVFLESELDNEYDIYNESMEECDNYERLKRTAERNVELAESELRKANEAEFAAASRRSIA
jgi:hypothetical protein